jgi:hypothetical protein
LHLRSPVDNYPKEAVLADFPLNIKYFKPFGPGNPLGGFADFFQIQLETPRAMPVYSALQPAQQKSGLAPTHSCDPLQSEIAVYSAFKSKARYGPKSGPFLARWGHRGFPSTLGMSLYAQQPLLHV